MTDPLVVLVPSRGRPENIARLIQGWADTEATARLVVVLDNDDPELANYWEAVMAAPVFTDCITGDRIRLGPTLNREALRYTSAHEMIGFMGDDHLPRTLEWDQAIRNSIWRMKSGFAYGNDKIQGAALPTAIFMSTDIVDTLGFMCPPGLLHMFLDNAWRDWGTAMGKLDYLPDTVIEHLHPLGGTAEPDDQYGEVNGLMGPDGDKYRAYKSDPQGFQADVEKLRALVQR